MEKITDPELFILMNRMAKKLDDIFKPYGFALLVFEFGIGGDMNFISNAKREDMISAMKEFIARQEGRFVDPVKGEVN